MIVWIQFDNLMIFLSEMKNSIGHQDYNDLIYLQRNYFRQLFVASRLVTTFHWPNYIRSKGNAKNIDLNYSPWFQLISYDMIRTFNNFTVLE